MSRNSFSKEFHLLSAKDFSYLRQNSYSLSNRYFRFYYNKTRLGYDHARLGISVSKKVGKANERNLIKRYVREVFRTSALKFKPLDVLVVASPRIDMKNCDRDELQRVLKKTMNESFILSKVK